MDRDAMWRTLGAPPTPHDLDMLAEVAVEQRGLLTWRQCLSAGMSDRAIRWRLGRRGWTTVHHGVYLTLPGRDDWRTQALAAQLAVPGSAWAGRTAAFVQGLVRDPPAQVELVVGADRRVISPRGVGVRRRRDVDHAVDQLHWPWRTLVPETVLDVTSTAPLDTLLGLLGRALQRGLTTEEEVRDALALRRGHRHGAVLRDILAMTADGAESAMEIRYIRDVERPHGLPCGRRQRPAPGGGGERHDIGYDEQQVLVELDGRLGHAGFEGQQRDGRRDRRGATRGWLTIRAYWPDVAETPCELAVDVENVLLSRGARRSLRACRKRSCTVRGTAAP